jgi:iron complex transport system ATP-binding protein
MTASISPSNAPLLATSDLELRIGSGTSARTLVQQLNWQVQAGECWVIIGRNGAGKSTLLKSIAGLVPAQAGNIQMAGKALADWPLKARAQHCGYLPQQQNDAFGYTVQDVVLAARYPHVPGYWENQAEIDNVQTLLAQADIQHLAQRDVRTLSGGERQRTAIAALLAQDTPLVLLDEPANALDLAHQISLMQLLSRLHRQAHKGVVMVSHDLNLAANTATHALLLHDGGAWQAGTCAEVMTPAALGTCLGYPVERIEHQGRAIFLPKQTTSL